MLFGCIVPSEQPASRRKDSQRHRDGEQEPEPAQQAQFDDARIRRTAQGEERRDSGSSGDPDWPAAHRERLPHRLLPGARPGCSDKSVREVNADIDAQSDDNPGKTHRE